ncbi:hypothetical protein [Bradyrhizobium sp. BWC-3-1]|nr:hypothetical protein [Bradyrhizobium sp. BWC-3-1]WOH57531.1 hypothetical protein RX329_35855 [Bradyrhizobium sp. BWC-3-1]
MQKITSQKKSPRALVAGAMQIARLLQHPVDASADESAEEERDRGH